MLGDSSRREGRRDAGAVGAAPEPAPARASGRSDRTRRRLLLVAERLLGEGGFQGASLRQIGLAADQSNPSVIQYHFKTKENLIAAVLRERVHQMEPIRVGLLEKAAQQEKLQDPKTLLAVLCLPHLDVVDEDGRHSFSRFLSEYITRYRPLGLPNPYKTHLQEMPAVGRTLALLHDRLSFLPFEQVEVRTMMCVHFFLQALIAADSGGVAGAALEATADEALEMATAALMSIPPPRRAQIAPPQAGRMSEAEPRGGE